ncbi:alkaline phosphatase [Bacillus sp. N9]
MEQVLPFYMRALIGWTTNQHTGVDIPVYAFGPGSKLFRGLFNNTDIPKRMAQAMNIQWTQGSRSYKEGI